MDLVIEQRLAVIEAIVLRLEERLFGNGQPGEIAAIKGRLNKLESWFWRLAGAAGVLAALMEIFDHRFSKVFPW